MNFSGVWPSLCAVIGKLRSCVNQVLYVRNVPQFGNIARSGCTCISDNKTGTSCCERYPGTQRSRNVVDPPKVVCLKKSKPQKLNYRILCENQISSLTSLDCLHLPLKYSDKSTVFLLFSSAPYCGTTTGVPVETIVMADCWSTAKVLAQCRADGLWYPYGNDLRSDTNAKPSRYLCQPQYINAPGENEFDVLGK